MNSFSRCLLVVNPAGTSYRRSMKLRASVEKSFDDRHLMTVRLTKAELHSPRHLRRELKKLDADSLLVVIGGDGTVNFVITELLKLTSVTPKKAVVLPLWGGNACDLAHMLNGRRRNSAKRIIRRGKILSVRPIEYRLRHGRSRTVGYAMCYLSLGSVALTARALDKSRFVGLTAKIPVARLITEVGVGSVALMKAKRFKIEENHKKMYDLLFMNGPRIAKLYRSPARLSRTGFLEIRASKKHPAPVIHSLNMLRVWLTRPGHTQKSSFRLLDPVWMQADGEVRRVESYTDVQVTTASQPIRLLATK
jgi:hypothetical protein